MKDYSCASSVQKSAEHCLYFSNLLFQDPRQISNYLKLSLDVCACTCQFSKYVVCDNKYSLKSHNLATQVDCSKDGCLRSYYACISLCEYAC